MSPSIGCPRCGGPIRFDLTGPTPESIKASATDGINALTVDVTLNRLDVLRHAASCYDGPPGGGEPLPLEVAA